MKTKRAFSLIEISLVLLIIGIIIAGVTQSSDLVLSYKVMMARNTTKNSPVAATANLILWLETVLDESFDDTDSENNNSVSTWYDVNPIGSSRQTLTQTLTARPTYIEDCMNELPCLRFDGTNDKFTFDGGFLVGTDYTIFIVEQRRSNKSMNMFIGGSSTTLNSNLQLGYRTDTTYIFDQLSNDHSSTVAAYTAPIARIHSYLKNSTLGRDHYVNGTLESGTDSGTGSPTDDIAAFPGSSIGHYSPEASFFNGDLTEIIMYNRTLNTKERQAVEKYLGEKWRITVAS